MFKKSYMMAGTIIILAILSYCTGTNLDNRYGFIVPFNENADWKSEDTRSISTGLGVADINKDGFPDIIVSNGNDIERQPLVIYYNHGSKGISTIPSWKSDDIDYHGHLATGDLNGDGYDDVAVSVYLGEKGFLSKGELKIYYNRGGELETEPSFVSKDKFYTFSLDIGDIDNDGDLDISVATGESYHNKKEHNRIYINDENGITNDNVWIDPIEGFSMDTSFADFDADGDLDVVYVNAKGESYIYLTNEGTINDKPYWQSQETTNNSNSVIVDDFDRNGFFDLAITGNYQQGGSGRTNVYLNFDGNISTYPDWTSRTKNYGSGLIAQDINFDDYPELFIGSWGEEYNIGSGTIRLYPNLTNSSEGGFHMNTISMWETDSESVVEAILFADINIDGIISTTESFHSTDGRSLFYLEYNIEDIQQVYINKEGISFDMYCYKRFSRWVSINKAIVNKNDEITVVYTRSHTPDMIVSNWDSDKGNYIYYFQHHPE